MIDFKMKVILLLLLTLLIGCGEEKSLPKSGIDENVDHLHIDQSKSHFVSDASDGFSAKIIKLSAETVNSVGNAFDGFYRIDGALYAYSTFTNGLVKFTDDGEPSWMLKGGANPIDVFSVASLVRYNEFKKQFDVFDGNEITFYSYDLDGNLVGKLIPEVNLLDRAAISESKYIYDATVLPNTHLEPQGGQHDFYLFEGEKHISSIKPRPLLHPGIIPYDDKSNFVRTSNKLYHKANFSDSVFQVTESAATLKLVTSFSINNRGQEILDDNRYSSKASAIYNEGIPHTLIVVPGNEKNIATYFHDGNSYFFAEGGQGSVEINTRYLKIGEEVIPTPIFYSGGNYFSVLRSEDREALKSAWESSEGDDLRMKNDFLEISKNTDDRGAVYIYIISAKQ